MVAIATVLVEMTDCWFVDVITPSMSRLSSVRVPVLSKKHQLALIMRESMEATHITIKRAMGETEMCI